MGPNEDDGSVDVGGSHIYCGSSIEKVVGSSVKTPQLFAIQDDLLAYAAGSGVVVSGLSNEKLAEGKLKKSGLMKWQRFYCVNSNTSSNDLYESLSANAYLNKYESYHRRSFSGSVSGTNVGSNGTYCNPGGLDEYIRDSYGFSNRSTPIKVGSTVEDSPINGSIGNDSSINGSGYQISTSTISSSPSKALNRLRTITYITISPNKKLMAVGEAGYKPRVIIYSLAEDLSRSPIAIIQEHTFGIASLAFDSTLQYLCSLGYINDGFIHVWKITPNNVTLVCSNKCTSLTNHTFWHHNYIITLGLRFIKVWNFENVDNSKNQPSFSPATLRGKNVVLGSFINLNFTRGCSLNSDEILVLTDCARVLLLKLTNENYSLVQINLPESLKPNSIGVDYINNKVWFGNCCKQQFESIDFENLKPADSLSLRRESVLSPVKQLGQRSANNTYMAETNYGQLLHHFGDNQFVYLSSEDEVTLFDKMSNTAIPLVDNVVNEIIGLKLTSMKDFLVISKSGILNKLLKDLSIRRICSIDLPSNEVIENSLLCADIQNNEVAFGDKYGNVYICTLLESDLEEIPLNGSQLSTNDSNSDNDSTNDAPREINASLGSRLRIKYCTKAHSSSVNDIMFMDQKSHTLVFSISRDRMIQVFSKSKADDSYWDILQTIPIHTGNLIQIFQHNDLVFVSSSDRTISIHNVITSDDPSESLMMGQKKVIMLKATPITMKASGDELIVSTNDKSISVFSLETFELKKTFKLSDETTNDSLLVDNFVVHNNKIVAFASDKSLRVFSYNTGKPISVSWGHLDSILGFSLGEENDSLISIGADGCIFKWNLSNITRTVSSNKNPMSPRILKLQAANDDFVPLYAKVTRKIISTPISAPKVQRRLIPSSISNSRSPSRPVISPNRVVPVSDGASPSPVPKLTSATLKRLQSKKSGTLSESTNISNNISPSNQKFRSSRPTSSITKKLYSVAPADSIPKKVYKEDVSPSTKHQTLENPFLVTRDYISKVRNNVEANTFSKEEKDEMAESLKEILKLLNTSENFESSKPSLSDFEEKLLESYSDKLVEMFESKLDIRGTSSLQGIFKRIYSTEFKSEVD